LTSSRSIPLIEHAPFVRAIHTVDVSLLTGKRNMRSLVRLVASFFTLLMLRLKRYDTVIDLMAVESPEASRRRKLLIDIIRPKTTVGRNTNGWATFYDQWAPEELLSDIHEVTRKLSVLRAADMIEESSGLELFSTEEDKVSADALVESIGGDGSGGIAVLVPGSWRPTRRWDEERFIAVGTAVFEKHGIPVIVCGGRDELDVIDRVAGGIPGAVSLIDLPPRVLFELFRRVSIVITNDTGPMHIAAAARAPIVSIFGPENPNRYAPGGTESPGAVVSVGADCAPCVKFTCDDMKCLRGIDVEMVLEAVECLLSKQKGKPESV